MTQVFFFLSLVPSSSLGSGVDFFFFFFFAFLASAPFKGGTGLHRDEDKLWHKGYNIRFPSLLAILNRGFKSHSGLEFWGGIFQTHLKFS